MSVRRVIQVQVALAMVLVMAAPISANPAPPDVGVFQGTMLVGKNGSCGNEGDYTVTGPGLGLSIVNGPKEAWFGLLTTFTGLSGSGDLLLCGELAPMSKLALGASCDSAKIHNGKGKQQGGFFSRWWRKVQGKITEAGTYVLESEVVEVSKNKDPQSHGIILMQAQGGAACLSKSGQGASKSGGATAFTVAAVYAILPVTIPLRQQELPIICKSDTDPVCAWQAKPEG